MNLTPNSVLFIGFGMGFLLVFLFFSLTLKDFLGAYLGSRFGKGKRLLAIHSVDGINVFWKVGFLKDGLWQYKHKKEDVRAFSIVNGVVKRTMGINMIHLLEGVTAPFNFKDVFVASEVMRNVPVLDDEENPLLDDEENPIYEKKSFVEHIAFNAYFDAKTIIACLESALSKKASRASMSFGGLDFKKILIILGVAVGVWYVVTNFIIPTIKPTI